MTPFEKGFRQTLTRLKIAESLGTTEEYPQISGNTAALRPPTWVDKLSPMQQARFKGLFHALNESRSALHNLLDV